MGEDLKNRYHVTKEGEIYRINDDGTFTDLGNAEKLGAAEQRVGKQKSQPQKSRSQSKPSKTASPQKPSKKKVKPKEEDDDFSFGGCLLFVAFGAIIIWGIIDAIW